MLLVFAAVENYLKVWSLRRLYFRGRAIVVNALALSYLVCGDAGRDARLGAGIS